MNCDSSHSASNREPKDKFSCIHVEDYKNDPNINSYRIVHELFVSCITDNFTTVKAKDCLCNEELCTSKHKRIHGCLYCVYFGCRGVHIQEHSKSHNHPLAIDINSGHVYCFICKDYKYDNEFEEIAREQNLIAAIQRAQKTANITEEYKCAQTMKQEAVFFKLYHSKINYHSANKITGLRGIVNMGNTCYISVILQSLLHAPIIREYFLSGKHEKTCLVERPSKESTDEFSDLTVCFSCEFGKIVQEFYSEKEEIYIPFRLLRLIWRNAVKFIGSKMQDAHEFLLALLNLLHKHCKITNDSPYNSEHHANCIMEKFFTGISRSEITCQECETVTSTIHTFNDISLNLDCNSGGLDMLTLENCLKRLTETKALSHDLTCDKCSSQQKYSEQMKLRKLPIIITFHVNRMTMGNYNDRIMEFPEELDMTPFVSSCKNSYSLNFNKYHLFAVVQFKLGTEHKSKKKREESFGHYVCYIRMHNKKWYLCDDTATELTTLKEIMKIPAYLLFYHKEYLQYNVENVLKEYLKNS